MSKRYDLGERLFVMIAVDLGWEVTDWPILVKNGWAESVMKAAERLQAEASRGADEDWRKDNCPNGCGCSLMTWWNFCPACGKDFR